MKKVSFFRKINKLNWYTQQRTRIRFSFKGSVTFPYLISYFTFSKSSWDISRSTKVVKRCHYVYAHHKRKYLQSLKDEVSLTFGNYFILFRNFFCSREHTRVLFSGLKNQKKEDFSLSGVVFIRLFILSIQFKYEWLLFVVLECFKIKIRWAQYTFSRLLLRSLKNQTIIRYYGHPAVSWN